MEYRTPEIDLEIFFSCLLLQKNVTKNICTYIILHLCKYI